MTSGSRTTGSRRDAGWRAPSSRADRSAASRAAAATSRSANVRPTEKPYPVWVSSPSPAIANDATEHTVRRARRLDAERARDRGLDRAVAVGRGLDAAHARVGGPRRGFELERERDLVLGGDREQLVAPEVELRRARPPSTSAGLGEAVAPRPGAEARVVARLGERLGDDVGVERARPRVALPVVDDDAARRRPRPRRPRATRPRRRTPVTSVSRDRSDVRLDLLARPRHRRDAARDLEQVDCSQSSGGAADGQLADPQRRLAGRHRHALAVLAARAGPGVEVVADRVDADAASRARCR